MNFREEISRPGLVMDLMSAALIFSVPTLMVVLGVRAFDHAGHDWHDLVKRILIAGAASLVIIGVKSRWKRRKSNRQSVS